MEKTLTELLEAHPEIKQHVANMLDVIRSLSKLILSTPNCKFPRLN